MKPINTAFVTAFLFFFLSQSVVCDEVNIEYQAGYSLIRGESLPVRPVGPQPNVREKWRIELNKTVRGMDVADYNLDGRKELVIATHDNTVYFIRPDGELETAWNIGNPNVTGSVYDILVGDIDHDFAVDLVVATGRAKSVKEYSKNEIIPASGENEIGVTHLDKVLYKITRNLGSIRVYNMSGHEKMRRDFLEGVRTLTDYRAPGGSRYVVAGIGEMTIYTYNEQTDKEFFEKTWEDMEPGDTKVDCIVECGSEMTPDGAWIYYCGFDDASDPPRCCCRESTGTEPYWELVDYGVRNGTFNVFTHTGQQKGYLDFSSFSEEYVGSLNVREIEIADLHDDQKQDAVVGLDNGRLVNLNISDLENLRINWDMDLAGGVTSLDTGKLEPGIPPLIAVGDREGYLYVKDGYGANKWVSRLNGVVVDIMFMDIEDDEEVDIVAASRNNKLYVFNGEGDLQWQYDSDTPHYSFILQDIDDNGLRDIIISTDRGLMALELTEFYVKTHRAETFYRQAEKLFTQGELTDSRIKVERAKSLFEQAGDRDNVPKCENLIGKLDNEIRVNKKREADVNYDKALSYYALNRFNESILYLNRARVIYVEIMNEPGVKKVDSMISQINREAVLSRKLRADSLYNKALTFKNFGNISSAVVFADQAKEIYEEIGYYNGSVKADLLVKQIADNEFHRANTQFTLRRYQRALTHAENANKLYKRVSHYNRSAETEMLIRDIQAAIDQPRDIKVSGNRSYTTYIIGALAVVILAVSLNWFRKKPVEAPVMFEEPPPTPEKDLKPLTEEFNEGDF